MEMDGKRNKYATEEKQNEMMVFEKTDKINKPLAKLIQRQRDKVKSQQYQERKGEILQTQQNV